MELRHLRYFIAVGEEQHYRRAAQRLRVAQPALSRQIQMLEEEIGFKLFERLPRGVKITEAGKLFLEDARRILREVDDAITRAKRVASGLSGTLRIGFVPSLSWHGIVSESLRYFRERRPDAELQPKPLSSAEQIGAVLSGSLDAGYIFTMGEAADELNQLPAGFVNVMLAVPAGHALTKLRKLRLRDLIEIPFILFPRRSSPVFFDRLMAECSQGGLKTLHVVQEIPDEAIIISLIATGLGVGFVSSASRWRCPPNVTLLPVADLKLRLPVVLIWRKDNNSPLLAKFTAEVKALAGRQGRTNEILV
ncbi:MAG TPA: LysR family transcriptional regulator [Candidatus Acidoferrales bacterium]|nr:LysR family transcriptional regulator [Candidatus Acidoferrales bacterium]